MGGAASAVFPSITGALLNGIGTNILAGGDIKKGLLMNASLLAGSGGMNSALGSAGGVQNASALANSQLPTAAFTNTPVVPAVNTAPFAMNPAGTPSLGGINPITASGPSTGMIPSSLAEPGVFDTVTGGLKGIGQFAQQNPYLTQMAGQTAEQMMQQPQAQFAPAGQVNRGQVQANDYMSLLNPQQSTVLRPQPISLLG